MENTWSQEQRLVAKLFAGHFGGKRERPLILYGLGRNTQAILALCPEIVPAGVMGPDTDETVWNGIAVLSTEQAAVMGADIVIVARNAVVPIIYRRIAALEREGARIFCVDGSMAAPSAHYDNENLPYWNTNEETLRQSIDSASYISFDLFDTLVGRRVLHPEDLFALVEARLPTWAAGFQKARILAGQRSGVCADIFTIYRQIAAALQWSQAQTEEAMDMEWCVEKENIVSRREMNQLFQYAVQQKKSVWILSDMYWSSDRLEELMELCGLQASVPVLVSCETGCSKEDGGQFRHWLQCTGASVAECLHIGDNRYADVEAAERIGVSAFRLCSGLQMLEESAAQKLLDVSAMEDRHTVGRFVARQFSSPFALHRFRGRLSVESPYDLGRDFLGPLMDFWLNWLSGELKRQPVRRMLFPARDGFLIHKLYELMRTYDHTLPPGIFFKASRRSMSVAALRTEADVRQVAERAFRGTVKSFFEQRFGITVLEETLWQTGSKETEQLLQRYLPDILSNAREERECYLSYLKNLMLPGDGVSGFFDFAAGGTVQHFYEKLTGAEVHGFYFATMNLPNDFYDQGEISAPFGNLTSYGCGSPLAGGYLMLESVLTDPDTTLVRIDFDGQPCFQNGKNNAWSVMEQIQAGIFDYVAWRLKEKMQPAGQNAAVAIWRLLFDGSSVIPEALRNWFCYEDTYDGAAAELCWISDVETKD